MRRKMNAHNGQKQEIANIILIHIANPKQLHKNIDHLKCYALYIYYQAKEKQMKIKNKTKCGGKKENLLGRILLYSVYSFSHRADCE